MSARKALAAPAPVPVPPAPVPVPTAAEAAANGAQSGAEGYVAMRLDVTNVVGGIRRRIGGGRMCGVWSKRRETRES
ncbi:hypothetical protein KPH14_007422 [Odynerus spinipes]|uniref:Uncharacterized protein n=1 Tax=Odynerus spinipes TaxID=1348599 RepID=A0AAD9RAF3_9HYME|nr:hypothetical protein KPH14_007422 [Odynerus spinipes]